MTRSLFVLFTLIFVATAPARPAAAQSCVGNCDGSAGTCYCDSVCTSAGDCCDDYAAVCLGSGDDDACSCTDADGNISVAGDYRYDTTRTGYVMVPAAAFTADISAYGTELNVMTVNHGIGMYLHSNPIRGTEDMHVNIAAPVALPLGATATELTCDLWDYDSENWGTLRLDLVAYMLGEGSMNGARVEISSADGPASAGDHHVVSTTVTAAPGSEYAHALLFTAGPSTLYALRGVLTVSKANAHVMPAVAFMGCRVTYTIDQLAP